MKKKKRNMAYIKCICIDICMYDAKCMCKVKDSHKGVNETHLIVRRVAEMDPQEFKN